MHPCSLSPAEAERATRARRHLRAVVERDVAARQALVDRVRAAAAEVAGERTGLAAYLDRKASIRLVITA